MGTRFSIITVCFNAERTLPATVASLAAQSYRDHEWVVVDGGSSDATLAVVHAAGLPLGNWVSERDRGIYDAMNKAVGLAQQDVLFFLNADDTLHDAKVLADVASAFDADPELDMLWGDVVFRAPGQQLTKSYSHINRFTIGFEDLCHQAIFARQRLFDRVGGFDLRWPTSADYDWVLRVFKSRAKVRHLPRQMAFFATGGAHTQDPKSLAAERRQIRLQYMSRPCLEAGVFASRAVHKMATIATGHPYSVRPMP